MFVIQKGEECKPCCVTDLSGRHSARSSNLPYFISHPRNPHFAPVAFHFAQGIIISESPDFHFAPDPHRSNLLRGGWFRTSPERHFGLVSSHFRLVSHFGRQHDVNHFARGLPQRKELPFHFGFVLYSFGTRLHEYIVFRPGGTAPHLFLIAVNPGK